MVGMFDQSLAEITRASSTSQSPTSTHQAGQQLRVATRRDKEVQLIAETIGNIRGLLAAFSHQYLGVCKSKVSNSLH